MAFWLLLHHLKIKLKFTHKLNFFKINGKPFLEKPKNLFFNLSHSHNAAICAVANKNIGADLELIRPINLNLANKICCPLELNELQKNNNKHEFLLKIWTAKESYAKMKASSIFLNLKNINYRKIKNLTSFKLQNYVVSTCCQKNKQLQIIKLNFAELFSSLNKTI